MTYAIILKTTFLPGLKAELSHIPHHNEVAINVADDIIYRNVDGKIVAYKPITEK